MIGKTKSKGCDDCGGNGFRVSDTHYTGLGDSLVRFCKECERGRQIFDWWSVRPEQLAYGLRFRRDLRESAFEFSPGSAHLARLGLAEMADERAVFRQAERYVDGWPILSGSGLGLLVVGATAGRRTKVATALTQEIISRYSASAVFLNLIEGRAHWRRAAGSPGTERLVERMMTDELLVLDGLGGQVPSERVNSLLFQIIDARWEGRRPMIITSGLSLNELAACYRPATVSRLEASCEVMELRNRYTP